MKIVKEQVYKVDQWPKKLVCPNCKKSAVIDQKHLDQVHTVMAKFWCCFLPFKIINTEQVKRFKNE